MAGESAGQRSGTSRRGDGCIKAIAAGLLASLSLAASTHWTTLDATSYCQGTITASGEHVYVGEVANNTYPLGTVIRVAPAVWGLTRFRVEDRIGHGSQIDFYTPSCNAAIQFGRRTEKVHVVSHGGRH